MADVDLDVYCARIGYSGPRRATLAVLRVLHRLHPAAIPFEAVDVQLGRGVSLDPAVIDAKLIGARRGGYCFEQNSLFKRVLRAMGFEVSNLLARVRWQIPDGEPRPATHMALRVRLGDEDWMADIGFGSATLTAPIRLASRDPQPTAYEPVRLRSVDDGLRLEVEIHGVWRAVYDLMPYEPRDVDYLTPNWFTSTHPDSLFRHTLVVSRTDFDIRYVLADNQLTVRERGAATRRRRLDADALERALIDDFRLPVRPDWRPVLERAVARGSAAPTSPSPP